MPASALHQVKHLIRTVWPPLTDHSHSALAYAWAIRRRVAVFPSVSTTVVRSQREFR